MIDQLHEQALAGRSFIHRCANVRTGSRVTRGHQEKYGPHC